VSEPLLEKALAKINLTLRVLSRRPDGYHQLESLVAFADLADKLTLEPGETTTLEISGPFAKACGPAANNLVLKAVTALRQRKGGLNAGAFVLEKNIPVAAGIGGGSADAAAALRLLARANGLALDDPRLTGAAAAVGADVPVCLDCRPRIVHGYGDVLSDPLYVPPLSVVLVNPGVPLLTRDVFAAFADAGTQGSKKFIKVVPRGYEAMIDFLFQHGNDLTRAAISCLPVMADMMIAMRALPAVRLIRMSGSGPTCFALFASPGESVAAAQRLATDYKDWWIKAVIIDSGEARP